MSFILYNIRKVLAFLFFYTYNKNTLCNRNTTKVRGTSGCRGKLTSVSMGDKKDVFEMIWLPALSVVKAVKLLLADF